MLEENFFIPIPFQWVFLGIHSVTYTLGKTSAKKVAYVWGVAYGEGVAHILGLTFMPIWQLDVWLFQQDSTSNGNRAVKNWCTKLKQQNLRNFLHTFYQDLQFFFAYLVLCDCNCKLSSQYFGCLKIVIILFFSLLPSFANSLAWSFCRLWCLSSRI